MTIYIADHTGTLTKRSSFVRPIRIGAASNVFYAPGIEPDDTYHGNISTSLSHADLRLYHYVRSKGFGDSEYVALMQYRRMYFFGSPPRLNRKLWKLKHLTDSVEEDQVVADVSIREEYLSFLSVQTDHVLKSELTHSDIVANKISFGPYSVQSQYIATITKLYPDEIAYVDAWYDLRRILEQKIGSDLTSRCFDGNFGFFNNCIVTNWSCFLCYYDFLFEIIDKLDAYGHCYRLYGYLAERVLYPWILFAGLKVKSKSILLFE